MGISDDLKAFIAKNPWEVRETDWVKASDLGALDVGELAVYQRFRKLLENVNPGSGAFHYRVGAVNELEVTYSMTRGAADQVICKCTVGAADKKKIELMAVYLLERDVCMVSQVKPNRG